VEASFVSLARRIAISRSRISIRPCTRRRRLGTSFGLASILTRLPLSFSAKASFDFRTFREGSGIAEILWRGGGGVGQEGGADQARSDQGYLNSWLIDGSGNGTARETAEMSTQGESNPVNDSRTRLLTTILVVRHLRGRTPNLKEERRVRSERGPEGVWSSSGHSHSLDVSLFCGSPFARL
jgi:hypothetical protein